MNALSRTISAIRRLFVLPGHPQPKLTFDNSPSPERLSVFHLKLRETAVINTVREVLISLEILSSMYKFKIVRLDKAGQSYIAIIDIASTFRVPAGKAIRTFSEVEAQIAQRLDAMHGLTLVGLYWRNNMAPAFVKQVTPLLDRRVSQNQQIDFIDTVVEQRRVDDPSTLDVKSKRRPDIRTNEEFLQSNVGVVNISPSQYGDI